MSAFLIFFGRCFMIKKKKNIIIWAVIAVLVISALLPVFISLGKKNDNKTDNAVITDTELDIVDYDVEFKQNSYYITLLSGEIKTNVRVKNVFINVNGYGCQDLKYTQVCGTDGYYVITLTPVTNILSCVFDSDIKITADIYVEYASRSHKVTSKDIDVKSCWTNPY